MGMKISDVFKVGEAVVIRAKHAPSSLSIDAKDLGVVSDKQALVERIFSTKIRLYPKNFLAGIYAAEREARDALDSVSVRLDVTQGRFVLTAQLPKLEEKVAKAIDEYDKAVNAAADSLPSAIEAHAPALAKAVTEIAKDEMATAVVLKKARDNYPTPDQFRDAFNLRLQRFRLDDSEGASKIADAEKDVADMVRGMVADLRSRVTDKLADLREVIKSAKGNNVNKRSLNAAIDVLNEVEPLIMGDSVLSDQIKELRSTLNATQDTVAITNVVERAEKALLVGIDDAVKQVQDRITGLGKRKIVMDSDAADEEYKVEQKEAETCPAPASVTPASVTPEAKLAAAPQDDFTGWST